LTKERRPHPLLTSLPSKKIPALEAAQSLCMACGLCCDGTLFAHVKLKLDDDIDILTAFGIQIISEATPPKFKQRCAAYKNCSCSIYPARPPCRTFRCLLLKQFETSFT
jgi:hypothetical protein